MKFEEILIFGSMIVFVGVLFFTSGGTLSNLDKLPSEFDGRNVIYPAGETFTLTFNANKTSDKETKLNMASSKYPYSESWGDIGNGQYDDGESFVDEKNYKNKKYDKGEKFVDANKNKKWDKGEKFTDEARKNKKWDKGEKYTDVPDGEYTHFDVDGKRFEEFSDDDLNGVWTQDLLEFRWEKVISKGGNRKQKVTSLPVENLSKPWLLTYEGNDQGRFNVRLTVSDYRSTNRNEQYVVTQEEWHFNCKRILEKAPKIVLEKVRLTF